MDCRDRHVVITGGAGALGTAVVEALIASGAICHIPCFNEAEAQRFTLRDHKQVKLVITAQTYEVNSPAEVLVKVLDSKGAVQASSNPATVPVRFEFTPAADRQGLVPPRVAIQQERMAEEERRLASKAD